MSFSGGSVYNIKDLLTDRVTTLSSGKEGVQGYWDPVAITVMSVVGSSSVRAPNYSR